MNRFLPFKDGFTIFDSSLQSLPVSHSNQKWICSSCAHVCVWYRAVDTWGDVL